MSYPLFIRSFVFVFLSLLSCVFRSGVLKSVSGNVSPLSSEPTHIQVNSKSSVISTSSAILRPPYSGADDLCEHFASSISPRFCADFYRCRLSDSKISNQMNNIDHPSASFLPPNPKSRSCLKEMMGGNPWLTDEKVCCITHVLNFAFD